MSKFTRVFSIMCAAAGAAGAAGCGADTLPSQLASRALMASASGEQYSAFCSVWNPGAPVNSTFIDNSPELSKDGLSLYFGSNRPGGQGSQDIWVSRRESESAPWGEPINLGPVINTAGVDNGAHLSTDGHLLFFTTIRADGFAGSQDLYVSWRADVHDDLAWETPVNLGAGANSPIFDAGPTLWANELYFARGPGMGANGAPSDIYLSQRRGGVFDDAQLVTELSLPAPVHDQKPSIRFDGREIFLTSDRAKTPGGSIGDQDIYVSTRDGNGQPWETPVNVTELNTTFRETTLSLSDDGTLLLFASDRPGGLGNIDIWIASRARGGSATCGAP
jgi:hypothetical protein